MSLIRFVEFVKSPAFNKLSIFLIYLYVGKGIASVVALNFIQFLQIISRIATYLPDSISIGCIYTTNTQLCTFQQSQVVIPMPKPVESIKFYDVGRSFTASLSPYSIRFVSYHRSSKIWLSIPYHPHPTSPPVPSDQTTCIIISCLYIKP